MDELKITEYNNIRVLTAQQLADAYGTEVQVITNNFNRNKDKYIPEKHFICLTGVEKSEFIKKNQNDFSSYTRAKAIYLWTDKGAFLHAKSLNTDTAWEVYDRLVDSYFKKKEDLLEGISPELRAVIAMDKRITTVAEKVGNLENTMNIDYAQQKRLKNLANTVVIAALGGKSSAAYNHKSENGAKMSAKCFSRLWNDFKDYFDINAYANLPRMKFNDAMQYINRWQPPTNMQLEIGEINRQFM